MSRPHFPLGDYYQLLLKNGLLSDSAPLHADLTREVRLVSCDSQTVVPGTLFICKGAAFKPQYLLDAAEKGAGLREELADVMSCCVLMADVCGLDLDEILREKVAKNEAKYPVEKARGRADKYTELT